MPGLILAWASVLSASSFPCVPHRLGSGALGDAAWPLQGSPPRPHRSPLLLHHCTTAHSSQAYLGIPKRTHADSKAPVLWPFWLRPEGMFLWRLCLLYSCHSTLYSHSPAARAALLQLLGSKVPATLSKFQPLPAVHLSCRVSAGLVKAEWSLKSCQWSFHKHRNRPALLTVAFSLQETHRPLLLA